MTITRPVYYITYFLILLLGISSAIGRQRRAFTHFQDPNGLPVGRVTALLQDYEGSNINGLYEDKDKRLWIAGDKGLQKFNREDNSFTTVAKITINAIALAYPIRI